MSTLSTGVVRHYLKNGELEKLFIEELGWDRNSGAMEIPVDGHIYELRGFAEKRGVQIFECQPNGEGTVPDYQTRRKIEKQVTKSAYEHLIVFVDGDKQTQIWQWVARQPGTPAAFREHHYHPQHQSGDALIQKLSAISIPLDEEEALDLTGTVHKLRDAFDRDRVTRKFYDHFKQEHGAFLKFIKGVTGQGDQEWYASLMLNRLMFVYFIQKKGFLDGNLNYLQDRLRQVQSRKGKGKFHSFYQYFLRCLFHEGFSTQPKHRTLDADLKALIGEVPYLNGGLFDVHEIEEKYPKIDIPDEAFEKLFAFFDQYDWHLDARPLSRDNEINPEVLGYIFEKYINQKQMGAYYTKEDITEYIGKSTIVPYLFDAARKHCDVAFEPGSAAWRLLADDPDRYINPAMRKGVIDEHGEVIPLPKKIAAGIKDVKKRADWNRAADEDFALPTETWREHVARRQRCLELRENLSAGNVHEINDLITYNLDIRQFAEDVIVGCEGPELLRAMYKAIVSVTVLDPTCGSGAFLFAALGILEPLYEACLERMQGFVDDLDRSGKKQDSRTFSDFRKILDEVYDPKKHANPAYFILKSIIVNNLYGVDIMEEAVEICKLRLFLKLVAQVDKAKELEPLPDIDFNIRPGNTLVGFATLDEVHRTVLGTLADKELKAEVDDIVEEAEIVERAFQKFHEMQTQYGMDGRAFATQKQELRERLSQLADRLDQFLAGDYGITPGQTKKLADWKLSHAPLHWFAEFYGIMRSGGFDVIIGNPPYLQRSKLNGVYSVFGYSTAGCRDIYAWVVERVESLLSSSARLGLIVPVSIASSGSFNVLRNVVEERAGLLWCAHFANRPGQLFSGAQNRLTIFLQASSTQSRVFSTRYHRWDARNGEREALFYTLEFVELGSLMRTFHGLIPKVGNDQATAVLRKIQCVKKVSDWVGNASDYPIYWVRVPGYFCQFFLSPPMATPENGGKPRMRGEVNAIYCPDERTQRVLHALLNSGTYLQFYCAYTDGRHINPSDVKDFPFDFSVVDVDTRRELVKQSRRLHQAMVDNTSQRRKSGLLIDSVDSRPTVPILNKIDAALAKHYEFTNAELDFITSYDLKYRVGVDEEDGDE
jgi:hypothetical protein